MEYNKRKHNTPISTLIKQYLDKQGGKVVISRKEIEWRFNALDWRYQKQILFAFLASGMSDRAWAYKKLYVFWDNCFIPVIQDLWEKYNNEDMLTWLIIRYFPIEFLKENYMRLNKGRNYYYLCVRMSDVKGFVIDKSRFNEYDLLRIKKILGEATSLCYSKDLFFLLVYKYCRGVYNFRAYRTVGWDSKHQPILSILNCPSINNMLLEIENQSIRGYDLAFLLREWTKTVTNKFLSLHEGVTDKTWETDEEPMMRKMQMEFCYEQIDSEYKDVWDIFDCHNQQQFLDYFDKKYKKEEEHKEGKTEETTDDFDRILQSPSLSKLVENLDLELIDDFIFF